MTLDVLALRYQISALPFSSVWNILFFQEIEESEREYFIEELYRHTKYSASHRRNDIALITVQGVMTFSMKIYPICIPPKAVDYTAGLECIISGWGDTESARGNDSFFFL